MRDTTLTDRFRYQFDNLMAKGPVTLIGDLFLMAALLVVIVALMVATLTSEGRQLGMGRMIWVGVMRTLDPGTMGGDEGSLVFLAGMFIVSDKLVSLMLSQISENKQLSAVFQDLFDSDGSELYLKPASQYIQLGKPVNFYTVLAAARQKGETPIGYRVRKEASDPAKSYGVHINPRKSELVAFEKPDRIILLAED